jgi:hypothetical protein
MSERNTRQQRALSGLLGPAGPEISCDECFEVLARFVELEHDDGAKAQAALPGMRAHLDGCAACREEHASLRALVASER